MVQWLRLYEGHGFVPWLGKILHASLCGHKKQQQQLGNFEYKLGVWDGIEGLLLTLLDIVLLILLGIVFM